MIKTVHPHFSWGIILLAVVTACVPQAKTVTPDVQYTEVAVATRALTEMLLPTSTATASPTSTALPVPTETPNYYIRPMSEVLPPGQYLVYVDECDISTAMHPCNLRAISVDGSVDQLLAENLSGDASVYKLAYGKGRVAFTVLYNQGDMQRSKTSVLNLEHSQVLEVQVPAKRECEVEDWSPDGAYLVMLCHQLGSVYNFDIALLSVSSGELTVLLHDQNQNNDSGGYDQPRWSPDGKWLAYYRVFSHGPANVEGVYVTDMACVSDPSTCEAKTRRLAVTQLEGKLGNRIICWTPDGYLAQAIDNQIDIYDVERGEQTRTLQTTPKDGSGNIRRMAWSPDGKYIAIIYWNFPGSVIISVDSDELIYSDMKGEDIFWITVP